MPDPDPLRRALAGLSRRAAAPSFGPDIDEAHQVLLSDAPVASKQQALLSWIIRHQPCVFAKIAARKGARPALDLCWITDEDLDRGAEHVQAILQEARRRWKQRAVAGSTSSLQVMFNSDRLAMAEPSAAFVDLCLLLVGLYLPEWAPITADSICLDGLPLRRPDGRLELYAASMTTFFTGAHGGRAHDHRVPGGVMLNVNAVGHHTWAEFDAGKYATVQAAIDRSRRTALRSVGNGGIGHPQRLGSTWHLTTERADGNGRLEARRPGSVPPGARWDRYGSLYHIDVTVGSRYAEAGALTPEAFEEGWTMMLDYFDTEESPAYHNSALMHGMAVGEQGMLDAPWQPQPRPHTVREF